MKSNDCVWSLLLEWPSEIGIFFFERVLDRYVHHGVGMDLPSVSPLRGVRCDPLQGTQPSNALHPVTMPLGLCHAACLGELGFHSRWHIQVDLKLEQGVDCCAPKKREWAGKWDQMGPGEWEANVGVQSQGHSMDQEPERAQTTGAAGAPLRQ